MNLNVLDDNNGGIYNGYVYRGKILPAMNMIFLKRFSNWLNPFPMYSNSFLCYLCY